jgi:hypothetical protein
MQTDLFEPDGSLPEGLRYADNLLTAAQERELLAHLGALEFREAEYKEWRARRRIVAFGGRYDFSRNVLAEAPPVPDFLHPLRAQAADWAGVAPPATAARNDCRVPRGDAARLAP